GAVVRLPQVQGIIRSLVGPDCLYDHHCPHRVSPGHLEGQIWHADAIIDVRQHFDIQLFYYPHDTPREMGGTMFLPGSQFRRNHKWYGNDDRLEYANRIKFWRFLTGNEKFDANYWLTRIENMPERVATA